MNALPWMMHMFEITINSQVHFSYLPSSAFDHSRSGLDHPPFPLVALEYRIFKTRFGHSHSHKVEAIKLWTIFSHMQCSCHIFSNVIQTFLESGFFDLISLSLASILGLVTQKVKWGECEVVLFCGKFYGTCWTFMYYFTCWTRPASWPCRCAPANAHWCRLPPGR